MSKAVRITMALCGALLAGSVALSSDAHADSGSATWVGPNGGTVHWHGYGVPGYYQRRGHRDHTGRARLPPGHQGGTRPLRRRLL